MSKRNKIANEIAIANQPSLKQGDNPGLFNWVQCNQLEIKNRRMRQKGVRGGDMIEDMITEADNLRATWEGLNPILLAYKMEGWGTQSQQMREASRR